MTGLLRDGPREVLVVGSPVFNDDLARQGVPVEQLHWRPPAAEAEQALRALALHSERTHAANDLAVTRMQDARPQLTSVARAGHVVPGVDRGSFLHAGPPIAWADMCGPMRGAAVGAVLFEGMADTVDDATRLLDRGGVRFAPCHEHDAVGPMAGIISPSMPVWVVENGSGGNHSYCPVNEGMGRVLRFGAFHPEHITHLRWMRDVLAPALAAALRQTGPIDVRPLLAQALQMGDECHNRHKASTALFLRELMPALFAVDLPAVRLQEVASYLAGNEIFFLNPAMATAKSIADSARGVAASTIAVALTRNGVEFGLQVSGADGRWFTAPASVIDGLYFTGFTASDANPDLGDSAITETVGLGGMAIAAAPAVVQVIGGTVASARSLTGLMYEITWSESADLRIPPLGFRGTPLGIDCAQVARTGVAPVINTGIAHHDAGVGQVGAGISRPLLAPFVAAVDDVVRSL